MYLNIKLTSFIIIENQYIVFAVSILYIYYNVVGNKIIKPIIHY